LQIRILPGKLQCRLAKKAEAARVIHSMKLVAPRFADGEGVANDGSRQIYATRFGAFQGHADSWHAIGPSTILGKRAGPSFRLSLPKR